jgi:hypothetical protein
VVTSIGDLAFENCSALATLSLPANPPTLTGTGGSGAFVGTNTGLGAGTPLSITVPSGKLSTYMSSWGVTADTIAVGNTAKYGNSHKRVFITDSGASPPSLLTTVADVTAHLAGAVEGGFAGDPVYLPALGLNLTDTGGNGWADILGAINSASKYVALNLSACTVGGTEFNPDGGDMDAGRVAAKGKIVSLVLPMAATSIVASAYPPNAAFKNFTALTSVSGANIVTVGDYAFYGCTTLSSVDLLSASTIGNYAFQGCTSLLLGTNFSPAGTIGDYAFEGCTSLYSVNIPSAASIGESAFAGCIGLFLVELPASSIGNYVFNGCTSLTSVTLSSATDIGNYVFRDCTNLFSVDLSSAGTIGHDVFRGCTNLFSVDLAAVTAIGSSAFLNTGTTTLTITLPQSAPTVVVSTPSSNTYSKTVIIKTPALRIGYDGTWPADFKLGFGSSADITLTIEELP